MMQKNTANWAKPPDADGKTSTLRDRARYHSRYAWVGLKRAVGMSITSDNRHMCERIVRGVRSGQITSGIVLAVEIRRDGFGSQVLSRLSVEAAARDLGLEYAHRPFQVIAHVEGDPVEWVARCESKFALGESRRRLSDFKLPMIDLTTFATDRSLWRSPHIVTMNNMHVHCDHHPDMYRRVIAPSDATPITRDGPIRIAAHVRRGDVSTRRVTHRFTSNATVLSTLEHVVAEAKKSGRVCDVTVYSNGDPQEFAEFADLGYRVDVTSGALDVFDHLRTADVLLTAKSTFSYIAALYARGIVLYEPFARRPLASWVTREKDGSFASDRLAGLLRDRAS